MPLLRKGDELGSLLTPISDHTPICLAEGRELEVPIPDLPHIEKGAKDTAEEMGGTLADIHQQAREGQGAALGHNARDPRLDRDALVQLLVEPLLKGHE